MAGTSAALALGALAMMAAFDVGRHAGAALNGRVVYMSVARVPMPALAEASALHVDQR